MAFWNQRIFNANRFYSEWEEKFKCSLLEQYYEGFMWKGRRDYITVNYKPYALNLVYSTIKIKLANLLFQKPAFLLTPRPGNSQWNLDFATQSAELKQDVLNTIIQNPNSNFTDNVRLSALDAFFRFGILEVGYAADWRNPQKDDLLFSDHGDDPDDQAKVVEDNAVPVNERLYFKRINAKRFRVAVSDATELNDHEWCGYYDFYYTKTLKKTKGIKFPAEYQNAIVSADYNDTGLYSGQSQDKRPDFLRLLNEGEISKVWHIWDMVEKKRLLLLDDDFSELWSTDCDRLPFTDLRWDYRLEGFYPLPPVFQWVSPQDEINEAREQTRSFRRRFTRKFHYKKNGVAPEEVEKFSSGPDGVVIERIDDVGIEPIQNPEQGQTAQEALIIAKDDFNVVSGTSAEARGQSSDRETATQAKLVDARAQVRESAEQMDFSVWLCEIGRQALTTAQESLASGLWIKYTTNPDEATAMTEVQTNQPIYKFVTSQQIDDGYDFDLDVDVMNQTPAAMQQAQTALTTFLSLCHQFPEVNMSPVLIRKVAIVAGMRDERVIHQYQQVALLAMAAKASQQSLQQNGQLLSQAAPNLMPGNGNAANANVAQMASPTGEQTQAQIQQQLQ